MKSLIESINATVTLLKEPINKYVTNKDVPLEERWQAALLAHWAFKTEDWHCHPIEELAGRPLAWYDDFNVERYQTKVVLSDDFVETFLGKYPDISEEVLKETILANGAYSFTHDW